MADYLLKVSRNALLDRLRVLQSDLTGENRHSDAMTVDFVIQILGVPKTEGADLQYSTLSQNVAGPKHWQAM
jgi:hypothetical protein